MAFCQHCGQQIPDNANACPYCGNFVNAQAQAAQQPAQPDYQQQNYQQQGYAQQGYQQNYQQGYAAPVQQAYVTPEMDVQQSRGIAWLAYMGLLFLIPMFVKKSSAFCQFHVKQGVTLCITQIAYAITQVILLAIVNIISPGYYSYIMGTYIHSSLYTVVNVLLSLGYCFFTVMQVIGIVNAATGKKNELPIFGKITWFNPVMDKIYESMNK